VTVLAVFVAIKILELDGLKLRRFSKFKHTSSYFTRPKLNLKVSHIQTW
jgi:hypothetical protein